MTAYIEPFSDEMAIAWGRLGSHEFQRRLRAEFCETCGATEGQRCMTKAKTTLETYIHAARYHAAVETFRKEQSNG